MPPAGQLVILRTDCSDAAWAEDFLQSVRAEALPTLPAGAQLVGPLPSPMQRRAGMYRWQLILLARDRKTAQQAAGILVSRAEAVPARRGLKWSVDVAPQDLY